MENIFTYEDQEGVYYLQKKESAGAKELSLVFKSKRGALGKIFSIALIGEKLEIKQKMFFFNFKSAGKINSSYILVERILSDFEALERGSKYIRRASDNLLAAWLVLGNKKISLNYYGKGYMTSYPACHTKVLELMHNEFGLKLKYVS